MEHAPLAVLDTRATEISIRCAVLATFVLQALRLDVLLERLETEKRNRIKILRVKIVQRATTKLVLVNQHVQSVVRDSFPVRQSKNQIVLANPARCLVTFVLQEPVMPLRINVLLVSIQIKLEQASARFVLKVNTKPRKEKMLALNVMLECFSLIKVCRQSITTKSLTVKCVQVTRTII